jgi:hypothetical protein
VLSAPKALPSPSENTKYYLHLLICIICRLNLIAMLTFVLFKLRPMNGKNRLPVTGELVNFECESKELKII